MFGEQIAGQVLNIQRVNESFDKYDRGEIFRTALRNHNCMHEEMSVFLALIQDMLQTQGPNSLQIIIFTAKQNIYCHTDRSVYCQTQH